MRNEDLLIFLLVMLFIAASTAYLIYALRPGAVRPTAIRRRIARALGRLPRPILWVLRILAASAAVYWLGIFGILPLLALVLCRTENWLHFRFDSKPLPITRKNLCRLAYGRGVRNLCVIMALSAVFIAVLFAIGRIDGAVVFPSLLVLWAIPLIDIFLLMRVQRAVLLSALRGLDVDAALQGKEMRPFAGAWQYSDPNWYICIGNRWCAVLCARLIDFSVPVQVSSRSFASDKGTLSTCEMLFAGKDGGLIRARLKPSEGINDWIHSKAPARRRV